MYIKDLISLALILDGFYLFCSSLNNLPLRFYNQLIYEFSGFLIKSCSMNLFALYVCSVAQLCLTLCNPMDCCQPGFSAHGVLQARILEEVAILSSRGSSWPRDHTLVSCIAGRFFIVWTTEPYSSPKGLRLNLASSVSNSCVIYTEQDMN